MVASRETLQDIAAERQLQPVTLERVIRLIDILDAFGADTLIGPRIALKGGTALNVFHSDLDRLLVDIDVNYVGAIEKERTDADRPGLEDRIERLMESKGYAARREPSETAWIACRRRQSDHIKPRTCRFSTSTRLSPARWLRRSRGAPRAICSMRIGSSPCRISTGRRSRRPP